jgi:hypothetical protein
MCGVRSFVPFLVTHLGVVTAARAL